MPLFQPGQVVASGIDDLKLRVRGIKAPEVVDCLLTMPIGSHHHYRMGRTYRRPGYWIGTDYYNSYTVRRPDGQRIDFAIIGRDTTSPLYLHFRYCWRRDLDSLWRSVQEFCFVDDVWDVEVVRADLFVDRVVAVDQHRLSVVVDGRFRDRTDPEYGEVSRRWGSYRGGPVRDYDKTMECFCKDRDSEYPTPLGYTVQRTEVSCPTARLRRVLGLGKQEPVRLPDLWRVGDEPRGPFGMIRCLRFRSQIAPQASRKSKFAWQNFRGRLEQDGIQPAYRWATRNRCVRTLFEETDLAEELNAGLRVGLNQFFGSLSRRGYAAEMEMCLR